MFVKNITLKNYRNYDNLEIELNPTINIITGLNAQGKTNLLESIFLSSIGKTFRCKSDKDTIKFGEDFAYIKLEVCDERVTDKIETKIDKNGKKSILINGIGIRKHSELMGVCVVVSFSPDDLAILKNSPAERRRFIDVEMCQLSNVYYHNLRQYNTILKQRNTLLKAVKHDPRQKESLFVWDMQLVEYGTKIIEAREKFVNEIGEIAKKVHGDITKGKENLKVVYKPNVTPENFMHKLEKSVDRDIMLGSTSVGVHKDDMNFFINDIDVRLFGSQGQQRTTALSLKLAEIDIIKNSKNFEPILLLDDVLSELDKERQSYLIEKINDIQVILTCTGVDDFINKFKSKYKIFYVDNGTIVSDME